MQNKKEMFVRVGVLTQIDPEKIEDLDVVMNAIIDGTISHESYAPAGFGFEEDDSNNGWISGEDIEFPFDHVALKDVVLNGLSTEALIAELQKRGVNVKPHGEKPHDTYLVTVDHVDGPSAQVCDTIGNAKAYVLGHTTNYDTFEEFDAALKGSIDAIDGVIEYSIVKQEAGDPVEFHGAVTENEVITLCTNLTAEKLDEVMRNHGFKFDENESTSRNIRDFADFIVSLNDTEDEVM